MDNLNKVISFILGLVVVVLFLAIISGRLNIRKNLLSFPKIGAKVTPTISPSPTPPKAQAQKLTPVPGKKEMFLKTDYKSYQVHGVTSIPNTGVPTILLPTLLSSLIGGLYLRKTGKK